tara:strand:+ start:8487 stop:11912 length:3426 start_codon:yes stop_codon:yes gene_type:complete
MALEKNAVSFPFLEGVDEKSSGKTIKPGALLSAENVQFEKTGQIKKREGFDLQGVSKVGGGSLSAAVGIAQYDDETLLFDGSSVYSRVGSDEWLNKGVHVPNEFSHTLIQQQRDRRQSNAHMQESGVARVYAWQEYAFGDGTSTNGGGKYRVVMRVEDAVTGSVLLDNLLVSEFNFPATSSNDNQLYNTPRVQCFTLGPNVYILWQTGNGNIYYDSINCTSHTTVNSHTVGSSRTIVTDMNTSHPVFLGDVAVNGYTDDEGIDEGAILVAWRYLDDTYAYKFRYFKRSSMDLVAVAAAMIVAHGTAGGSSSPGQISAYFEPWKDNKGFGNDIFLKCLNDSTSASDYNIVFGTTHNNGTTKDIRVLTIKANLGSGGYIVSNALVDSEHLLAGTAGTESDGGTVHIWIETGTGISGVASDTVTRHTIRHRTRVRNNTAGTVVVPYNDYYGNGSRLAWNSSITSDAFRYPSTSGKLYLAVSQVNDISLTRRSRAAVAADNTASPPTPGYLVDNSARGLNNNIVVLSSEDKLISAAPTGSCATCLTSEFVQRSPVPDTSTGSSVYQIRRLLYGVQRVTRKNSNTKFIFGSSKFIAHAEYDAGTGGKPNHKDNVFGISLCELDFDPDRPLASVQAGRSFVFTGGFLSGYDKSSIFEQGFVVYPSIEKINQATATGGAGLPVPADGDDIKYVAIYEWSDANGNVHRSRPSLAESFIPSATGKRAEVYVYPLSFSRKSESGRVSTVIYRTEPGGGTFFRVGSMSPFYPAHVGSQPYIDDGKNFDLLSNEILYSEDELENDFMGSCSDIVSHRGRVAAVRSDNVIIYSKPIEDGTEVRFPDVFSLVLPGDNSKVVGVESNLDHLLIFSEDNAYFISGEGPTSLGQNPFTNVRIFAAGQGARRGSAHVESPIGVFYQSQRGIYLVRRDLSVAYHGASVEDSSTRLLIGATVVDSSNEIRLLLSNSGSASGADYYLIYNYYFQKWALWTVAYTSSAWQVGEVYNGTMFIRATADGKIYRQRPGTYQDDNSSGTATNYSVTVQTGFIAAAGLLHAQRVYRAMLVGDYVSDHTLTISASYDYNLTSATSYSKSITSSNDNPMLVRMHLDQQKCRAVGLKITITGTGECAKLDGIALEVGRRKSSFKLESARTL